MWPKMLAKVRRRANRMGITIGAEARDPSSHPPDFNAEFYLDAYPDLRDPRLDPLRHWLEAGRSEGRIAAPPRIEIFRSAAALDPTKQTIAVVSHEASRTGAPILALNLINRLRTDYNVITILLDGGGLRDEFIRLSTMAFCIETLAPPAVRWLARTVLQNVKIDVALVNSTVSSSVLEIFASAAVPTVTLVHEFTSYLHALSVMEDIIRWSTRLVFSAPITFSNAANLITGWSPGSRCHILPQGRCLQQFHDTRSKPDDDVSGIFDGTPIILGAGSVNFRKGCDLFIQCAQQFFELAPASNVKFVWVGGGYRPRHDAAYSAFLAEQIQRSNLTGRVLFIDERTSIDDLYSASTILLMPSRLDPLPNVGIDAMHFGLPIVAFEDASGIADALRDARLGDACLAPYLDTHEMAQRLLQLIQNADKREAVRTKICELAEKTFSFDAYYTALRSIIRDAKRDQVSEEADVATIIESGQFEPGSTAESIEMAVRQFVREGRAGLERRNPATDFDLKKRRATNQQEDEDVFAAYLRSDARAASIPAMTLSSEAVPRAINRENCA